MFGRQNEQHAIIGLYALYVRIEYMYEYKFIFIHILNSYVTMSGRRGTMSERIYILIVNY